MTKDLADLSESKYQMHPTPKNERTDPERVRTLPHRPSEKVVGFVEQ